MMIRYFGLMENNISAEKSIRAIVRGHIEAYATGFSLSHII